MASLSVWTVTTFRRLLPALGSLAAALAGCAEAPLASYFYQPPPDAKVAVPPERVKLFDARIGAEQGTYPPLPPGVYLTMAGEPRPGGGIMCPGAELVVMPPNRLIGELNLVQRDRPLTAEEETAILIRQAGRVGATAVVRYHGGCTDENLAGHGGPSALAIELGQGAEPSASQLLEAQQSEIAARTKAAELAPVGEPQRRELATLEPATVEVERGACYWVAVALEPGAMFDLSAWPSWRRRTTAPLLGGLRRLDFQTPWTDVGAPTPRPLGALRAGVRELGCAARAGTVSVDFRHRRAAGTDVPPVGRGAVVFRFYARPITEPELDRMLADRARWDAERRGKCTVCARFLDGCGGPQSCPRFAACLERNGADLDDCELN
ncbi:MAG: hypothetical protein E6J90_05280 [Deltaproteobacteria bacterium]|nr:MAG: hypothetical protein E6J91_35400 [Deltaproteobacteria bacterium]TMQ25824.1 MAG: hypothetical protein E6J90_05280 [Deltaproteobacteria bacterium]